MQNSDYILKIRYEEIVQESISPHITRYGLTSYLKQGCYSYSFCSFTLPVKFKEKNRKMEEAHNIK